MDDPRCTEILCGFLKNSHRECNPDTCLLIERKKEEKCPDCGANLPMHSWWCETAKHIQFWGPVSV